MKQHEKIVRYILYCPTMPAMRICASPDIIHEEADKLRMGTQKRKGYENVLILKEE